MIPILGEGGGWGRRGRKGALWGPADAALPHGNHPASERLVRPSYLIARARAINDNFQTIALRIATEGEKKGSRGGRDVAPTEIHDVVSDRSAVPRAGDG